MQCPRCGKDNDKVLESRSNKDGTSIRRRRECLECGHRFTSYERIEEKPIMVIKKDGRHQPFDISKVERGIRQCTEKLAVSQEAIDTIARRSERRRSASSIPCPGWHTCDSPPSTGPSMTSISS